MGKRTAWVLIGSGLVMGAGLIVFSLREHSVVPACFGAGGIFAATSLWLNHRLLRNSFGEIRGAVMAHGYDRRGHLFARLSTLMLLVGIIALVKGL
ncbi:hypothetical protein [Pinirhizobacter sp.]|jgi:hypothetical protein|uniref:hypothetical protein n=1 Tax=Pinirhizobacter sp. TaxID=2950432 RepID=UPI002F42622C